MSCSGTPEPRGSRAFAAAVRGVVVITSGLTVGSALVASGSPAIGVVATLALGIAAILLFRQQSTRGLLFLAFMAAPVDISKSLIGPINGVLVPDAPGLSASAMDLAMFGWAGLWLWQRLVVERRAIEWSRADGIALAFLAWIWLEAFRSPAGSLALATALAYSKFVVVFFVLSHAIRTPRDWRTVMLGCTVIFGIEVAHVAAQVLTQSPLPLPGAKLPETASVVNLGSEGSAFRPMGFFNHPNALANYLVLLLPTPLCLVLLGRRRLSRRGWWLALAMLGSGSAMLALTLSRGGWVAFGLAAAACAAMCWRAGAISGRQVRLGALGLVILVVAVIASTPRLLLRLTEPDSRSLESRSLLVGQATEMIRDRPLIGVGFGGYYRASRDYSAPGFAIVSPEYQQALRRLVVHNHYLLLAVELGVPGALVFVALMLYLVAGVRPLRTWHDPGRFALAVGLASGLLGNLVFLSSDNYYADIRMALLWIVAGLLQAACLERREATRQPTSARPPGSPPLI